MLAGLGSILLMVGPLCTGLISAWFNLTGSRHGHTFPLDLRARTKLLH